MSLLNLIVTLFNRKVFYYYLYLNNSKFIFIEIVFLSLYNVSHRNIFLQNIITNKVEIYFTITF